MNCFFIKNTLSWWIFGFYVKQEVFAVAVGWVQPLLWMADFTALERISTWAFRDLIKIVTYKSNEMKGYWMEFSPNINSPSPPLRQRVFFSYLSYASIQLWFSKILTYIHRQHYSTSLQSNILVRDLHKDITMKNKLLKTCSMNYQTLCELGNSNRTPSSPASIQFNLTFSKWAAGLGEGSQHSEGSRNGIKFRICLTISSVNTWHPCHWIIWKDEFQSTHIHIDSSSSFIHTFAEKEWKGANKQRSIEKG